MMRTTALLLTAVIALGAAPARAEEPVTVHQRGFLTHVGVGLLIGGLFGLGAGTAGIFGINEAKTRLEAYSGQVTAAEQPSVDAIQTRLTVNSVLAGVGFVAGAVAVAVGIGCIIKDAPQATVAFVPTAQGGVFVLSARF